LKDCGIFNRSKSQRKTKQK